MMKSLPDLTHEIMITVVSISKLLVYYRYNKNTLGSETLKLTISRMA